MSEEEARDAEGSHEAGGHPAERHDDGERDDGDRAEGGYPQEVEVLEVDGRRIVLVGTAHISQSSVELVRRVVEEEQPDRVCVELDRQRHEALSQKKKWENLDLKELIRRKQLPTLLLNLVLAAYQKRLGGQLGILPGTELLEACRVAEELDVPVELCDRDVRVTLRRAAHNTPFLRKLLLMAELLTTLLDAPEISEEQLEELRQQDVLNELLDELGQKLPSLKKVLIDERDGYLAERIRRAEGDRLVAVVGAGHLQGLRRALLAGDRFDLAELDEIPPVSHWWKVAGWGVPVAVLGGIAAIAWRQGLAEAGDNLLFWGLANGIPTALGGILAFAHPLTVVAGFLAAPITSLTPVIGAAYVTAFVQAWLRPPVVKEFQTVADDITQPRQWWRNKLLRIFLAFLLPGFGSIFGSLLGGGKILSSLF